jgi:hypothetical protein
MCVGEGSVLLKVLYEFSIHLFLELIISSTTFSDLNSVSCTFKENKNQIPSLVLTVHLPCEYYLIVLRISSFLIHSSRSSL